MYNKEKSKKISLICDLYTENKTTIDENKYIELINNQEKRVNLIFLTHILFDW